ncbi:MAG: serine hydrolase domain-containing protein [Saprospiraceae bacterium]
MKKILLIQVLVLSFFSCSIAQTKTSNYNIAQDLNDGLKITNPAAVGINEDSLFALFDLINFTPPHNDYRALVVIKDGKLVVDEYFNSFGTTNINDIRSAGKSITSMLAGIAIKEGLFKPTDKVFSFFPEYKNIKNQSKEKSNITIANLLIMSSGLASDDYKDDSPGAESLMMNENDYLKFCLDLPMDFKSGSQYAYSSVVAYLLGSVIENTSKMKLEDFARKHLFGPLQITQFFWLKSPEGRNTGMGNIYLAGRDLAKLGQLMLNNGKWNNQQIIPVDYVKKSSEKHLDISDSDPFSHGYGYMWYIAKEEINGKEIDFFFASGNGGNKIFIVPSLNMVVATLSSAYGQGRGQYRSHLIFKKVLEATK